MEYKHNLILFCKSYSGDVARAEVLYNSIQQFNRDSIPFYLSIPKADEDLFRSRLGEGNYNLVFDEDLTDAVKEQSHFTQQLFKMEFYKTNIAEYFFLADSDMYFIKNFYTSDFLTADDVPYMTMHECKEVLELSSKMFGDSRMKTWFDAEREAIMEVFGRKGRTYDYSGSANLYASEVFRGLYDNYCNPNNVTFLDLLTFKASENTWYGEYALYSNFRFLPCAPMFKTFHFAWQYNHAKALGMTEDIISQNYLGITMQSNWGAPLKY